MLRVTTEAGAIMTTKNAVLLLAAALGGSALIQGCAAQAPQTPDAALANAPDLIVEAPVPLKGSFTIRNIGKSAAPASTAAIGCRRADIGEGLDSRPECPPFRAWHDRTVAGYWYSKAIPVGPLAPGASQVIEVPDWHDITLETGVSYRFHVEADIDQVVTEANEHNNSAESSRVQP
ncbi:MAG: hypothetical protein NVS9B10_08230 [Nevskia sp.]